MKPRYQNIGQWRATLYPGEGDCLLKITAVLPTATDGARFELKPIPHFSSPDYGLVFRLKYAADINVESPQERFFSSRQTFQAPFGYKKAIIIGFRPGAKHSFLIALIDIRDSPEELP